MNNDLYKEFLTRHQDIMSKNYSNCQPAFTTAGLWQEFKGNFILSPRRTGKTTALCKFATYLIQKYPGTSAIIIAPFLAQTKQIKNILFNQPGQKPLFELSTDLIQVFSIHKYRKLTDTSTPLYFNTHLLVDEFTHIIANDIQYLLKNEWHSVNMVGTGCV